MVRDVMTPDVIFVGPDTGYKQIAEMMLRNAVSAVPVVDGEGMVVGVVSELDLMHKIEFAGLDQHVGILERRRQRVARTKGSADTARELMTAPAVVIADNASLVAAATLMHEAGLKRLPVVDAHGDLVGIVSRGDLLRAYVRPDADIRAEIVNEVLRRAMWLEPYEVEVVVERGMVTLTGRVDRKSTAEITVQLVLASPGVVDVVDRLTFRHDDTRDLRRHNLWGPTKKETVP